MMMIKPQIKRFLIGFRVFVVVCLAFTTSLAGWEGQALAADVNGRDRLASSVVSSGIVLPTWFLSPGASNPGSTAPPPNDVVRLLASPVISDVNHSMPASEGSPITVTITAFDPSTDTLSYGFDWDNDGDFLDPGDVQEQSPNEAAHTWNDDGSYTVRVVVYGDGVTQTTHLVGVANVQPTIESLSNSGPVDEGLPVTITVTATDPGDDVLSYAYDWNENGVFTDAGEDSSTYTWSNDGVHTIAVQVDDGDGGVVSDTTTITVNDTGPEASFEAIPTSGEEPLTVQFTDTSTSNDGITARYWDFGDGSAGAGPPNPSHEYVQDGVYTVTLIVWDVDGDSDTEVKTAYITVGDTGPTAAFHADVLSGVEPLTVEFTDDSTAYDGISGWSWDFGDGSPASTEQTPTHQYVQSGVYTVTLTVEDGDGSVDAESKVDHITVGDTEPTANFVAAPTSGDESLVVYFTDTSTAYDAITGWDWDVDGDRVTDSNDQNPIFTYTASGVYTVSLTVWDADGSSDAVTRTSYIAVNNVPPTAVISAPTTQAAGQDAVFDASNSTEPGQDIIAYEWDLDDDGQYDDDVGITTIINLTAVGVYTVGLRVTDQENTTDTARAAITIVPAPLDHFVVSVPADSTAGVAFTTVITAEDEYGNVITDWDQNVTLSTTNGGTINPTQVLGSEFVNGAWSGPVSLTTAGQNRDVIASYDGHTGQDTLHVEPASATHFVFSTIGDQVAGVQSSLFNVTARDQYGNQDTNYAGTKTLVWSGLTTSPDGTAPVYPRDAATFHSGVAYDFRFTAYNAETNVTLMVSQNGGPSGASNAFTVTHAPASTFAFSTIPDQVAGSPGTFALTAQDDWDNTVTGYTGTHSLNWSGLGNSPNNDPPNYPPNPVSFANGVASSLAFTPYRAETGARIIVVEGTVSGASNFFDVSVAPQVGEIVIESHPGSAGSEVTTHDMVAYESFTVYAAGYDAWGNYIADQTVDWSGTGVAQGQVSPGSGTSTTLTPVSGGTGTIEATLGALGDATGLITVRAPILNVTLSDSPEPVEAGGALVYTIDYGNTGDADAENTILTLTLDDDVAYDAASPPPDSGSGQVRTWNLDTVAIGASGQVIVNVTVDSPLDNGTVLESVASLDSDQTGVVADSQETTVHSQPILHIDKSDLQDPVQAGGPIVYTIEFANTGNMNATGVVITDSIPANTSFESASHGGTYDPGRNAVIWNIGTLAVGAEPYRTLEVQVGSFLPSGTVITNSGYQIDSLQTAPVTGPDVTTAVLSPTLTVSQIGSPNPVEAGSLVTFTIIYSNTGDGDAHQVVITDVVPEHTSLAWASPGYTFSGGQVVWNIGTLPRHEGGTRTVIFRVASPLTDSTPILNQVSIDSVEIEAATYMGLVYVHSEPVLHLVKTAATGSVQAGEQLAYTLSYTNTGNANATSLVITDALPAYTTFADASDGGTYAGGIVTWDLGLLAGKNLSGQDGVGFVTLAVEVTSPLTNGTMLENVASIACAEGVYDQASVQTTVASLPQLHLDVVDSSDPIKGAETLVYTVHYTNTGNANATAVQLTADFDSHLTFVTANPPPSSGNNVWNLPPLRGEGGTGTLVVTLETTALAPDAVLRSFFSLDSAETGVVSGFEDTEAIAVDLSLGVDHGDTDDAPYPGERITYTLHYTNEGDIAATGVVMTVTLPEGVTHLDTSQGWTSFGEYYRYSLDTVDAGVGGNVQYVIEVNVEDDGRLPPGLTSLEPLFSIQDDGQNGPEFNTTNNHASYLVGIPDLVIDEIRVTPEFPVPDRPVALTVVIRNQGTGWAWNPVNLGGFFVDLFIDPSSVPSSYPWSAWGDFYRETSALAPNETREIVFVITEGLSNQGHRVYAKVDNFYDPNLALWQQNSLIPESDETNNVRWVPVDMDSGGTIFLPVVLKNR